MSCLAQGLLPEGSVALFPCPWTRVPTGRENILSFRDLPDFFTSPALWRWEDNVREYSVHCKA